MREVFHFDHLEDKQSAFRKAELWAENKSLILSVLEHDSVITVVIQGSILSLFNEDSC